VIPRHLILGVAVLLVIVLSMGIYLDHMRRSADQTQRLAADTRPVTAPPAGPTETVSLYVADDIIGSLRAQSAQIPLPGGRQQRAEELLRSLLRIYQQPESPHPLAAAAEIKSIYLVDPGVAVIDLNSAFAEQHRSSILAEQLTVNSFVETLAANVPGITRVRILVDGTTRETLAGHADLSDFFDVSAVGQAVTQGGQ
jgi:sporulation and spore germination protein